MAVTFDLMLVILQSLISPWRAAAVDREGTSSRFFEMFRRTAT
jgi:hypothetical protein